MDDRPIGIFDSGFGGLTVARAMMDLLPHEDLVYVGDTGRYPYGDKPLDDVRSYALEISRWLVDEAGVKMIVVACNTASAAALDVLTEEFDVPVVGVIEPGARAGIAATSTGRVGVIGTVGTISSGAYEREMVARGKVELHCGACPGFVEFVERGETDSDQVRVLAERLLSPMREANVDTLVLACTHYPFLARTIGDVMGRDVVLVSPAEETAFEVKRLLAEYGSQTSGRRPPKRRWCSSGDAASFALLGRRLLGPELDVVEAITWGQPSLCGDDGGGESYGDSGDWEGLAGTTRLRH